MLKTYSSKPAEIIAYQWDGDTSNLKDRPGVILFNFDGSDGGDVGIFPAVQTIHPNIARIVKGDYIVQEPDGEHYYPVKAEIFEKRWKLKPEGETESPELDALNVIRAKLKTDPEYLAVWENQVAQAFYRQYCKDVPKVEKMATPKLLEICHEAGRLFMSEF